MGMRSADRPVGCLQPKFKRERYPLVELELSWITNFFIVRTKSYTTSVQVVASLDRAAARHAAQPASPYLFGGERISAVVATDGRA